MHDLATLKGIHHYAGIWSIAIIRRRAQDDITNSGAEESRTTYRFQGYALSKTEWRNLLNTPYFSGPTHSLTEDDLEEGMLSDWRETLTNDIRIVGVAWAALYERWKSEPVTERATRVDRRVIADKHQGSHATLSFHEELIIDMKDVGVGPSEDQAKELMLALLENSPGLFDPSHSPLMRDAREEMDSALRPIWLDTINRFFSSFGPIALDWYCGYYDKLGSDGVGYMNLHAHDGSSRNHRFARRALFRLLDWLDHINALPAGDFTAALDVHPVAALAVAAVTCAMTSAQMWMQHPANMSSSLVNSLEPRIRVSAYIARICLQRSVDTREEKIRLVVFLLHVALKAMQKSILSTPMGPVASIGVSQGLSWITDQAASTDAFRDLVSDRTAEGAITIDVERFHTALGKLMVPSEANRNLSDDERKARTTAIGNSWGAGFAGPDREKEYVESHG